MRARRLAGNQYLIHEGSALPTVAQNQWHQRIEMLHWLLESKKKHHASRIRSVARQRIEIQQQRTRSTRRNRQPGVDFGQELNQRFLLIFFYLFHQPIQSTILSIL